VKTALQTAGLVRRRKKPGSHRKRRPRRPLPGMTLHIDGSEHRWFGDERYYERNEYIAEFNSRFTVTAAQKGRAFVRARRKELDWIFSMQHERTVNNDNTLTLENRVFQLDKTRWRNTLAGQTVVVHEHLDSRMSIRYGPHVIAQYAADQLPPQAPKRRGTPRLPTGRAA
jgi:hypothetical protein